MKARHVAFAAIAPVVGLAAITMVYAQVVTPDQLQYQRNPATGSEIAVVMGDPSKPGPFVVRVKYPAGFRALPHWHPIDLQVTVISGTMLWAEGETFDASKLKEYPEGSFIMEKAKVPHYQVAKTALVFQAAAAAGPQAFNFVNPTDDPRNQKK
jgi:quercetin dioxygenase-like cupin family protein